MHLTLTLTLDQLMILPGDAVIRLITHASPPRDFLLACHEHENRPLHGPGRWPVNNFLRMRLATLTDSSTSPSSTAH